MINTIFCLFQLTGGIILSLGYIPQIIQIIKAKSSEGLSLKAFIMIFAGLILYEIYAAALVIYNDTGYMYLITNSISVLINGILCLTIILYREMKR